MRFLIGLVAFLIAIVISFTDTLSDIGSLALGWNAPYFIIVVLPSIVISMCVTSAPYSMF